MTVTDETTMAPRRRRSRARGQVMVIFAVMSLILFAIVGLGVDAGLSYFTYNGIERAAAAGALAGVPYMPTGFGSTADTAARAAAARDGYRNGGTVNGHPVTVSDAQYPSGCGGVGNPCDANKLTVTVTAWSSTTFLRVLGFGDHKISATDTAFYLPPISLGQPGSQLGSQEQDLGSSGNYYILRSEGYGNPRSEGDAFDPDTTKETFGSADGCDATEKTAGQGTSTDGHELSANAGTDVTDGTLTGDGFNTLPERGGYNFGVVVPSTASPGYLRVYNPSFAPDGGYNPFSNNTTANYNMHEQDTSFTGNSSTSQYSAMEYTLFSVTDIFDHTQDVPIDQVVFDPINAAPSGSPPTYGGTFTDVRNSQVIPDTQASVVYHSWVDITNPPTSSTQWTTGGTTYNVIHVIKNTISASGLAAGRYRLRIDMLDYQGLRPVDDAGLGAVPCSRAHKGYAIQLDTKSGSTYSTCTNSACQMYSIGEMALYTPIVSNGSGFDIPIFQLPSDYKGTTVDVYVYDPGDLSSGTNTLSLINPDTGSVFQADTGTSVNIYDLGVSRNVPITQSTPTVDTTYSGCSPIVQPDTTKATVNTIVSTSCSGGSGNIFNGHWLLFQLPISSSYAGGSGGYWQLQYSVNGTATDTITIVVGYEGAPVHLLG